MSRIDHVSAREFEGPRTDDGRPGNHDRLRELGPHARREIIFVSATQPGRAGIDRLRRRGKSGGVAAQEIGGSTSPWAMYTNTLGDRVPPSFPLFPSVCLVSVIRVIRGEIFRLACEPRTRR